MGQETGKPITRKKKKQGGNRSAWIPFWGAVITAVATITVALLSSPVIIKWLDLRHSPSPTAAPSASQAPVIQVTNSVEPTVSNTQTAEAIPSNTPPPSTVSPELTPTLSSLAPGMRVIITASRTSGKAPLNVNLNAGDSYLLTEDGKVVKCGACSYTWSIRLGANFIYGPEKKDANFSFTFQKKGSYFVIVKVCRNAENEVCGSTGTYVVAN